MKAAGRKLSSKEVLRRARALKAVLMDVDGVLTSGILYHFVDTAGGLVELKGIHAQDSISLTWLADAGLKTGFISGRISQGVAERAKAVRVSDVYQHRLDKLVVFREICKDAGISPEEILYIGDDLPDIPVLKAAGLGVATANARPETIAAAHLATAVPGGQGALREVTEFVLQANGHWPKVLARFDAAGLVDSPRPLR